MKILVGEFITESNANIPQKCEISNYKMLFGDDCIQALHVADVFEQAGFELIPSVVADAGAAGVIKKIPLITSNLASCGQSKSTSTRSMVCS